MAGAFQSYLSEFQHLQSSLTRTLDHDIPKLRGEERKAALRRCAMDLDEADEIVEQMELQGKGNAKLMVQVRSAKMELKGWRNKVASLSSLSDRDLLLSSRPSHSSYPVGASSDSDEDDLPAASSSSSQRQRLLQSTQTLNTTSGRLDHAHRLAAENEEIGQGVLSSLVGQRLQLEGANEVLEEADTSINRASGTIRKMIRTAYRQKIVLGIFIAVLLALVALILWRKLR
ncbi:hypothetical protein JCM21900_001966 [Sporobolomyces salmonicolor]